MSSYKFFAVVGAGAIGIPIIEALLDRKASVLVLTRSSNKAQLPEGVKIATVDYDDVQPITRALRDHGAEVVISTLNSDGLASQNKLAEAAKEAGVKLFAPSEFGAPTEGVKGGFLEMKDNSAKYIQSIGLPTARFHTGFWTDEIPKQTGFTVNGKVNIVGKGDRPISFTATEDVAGFVAHVLTTLSASKLDNSVFRLQGDRATLLELGPILRTTVEHVDEVPGPDGNVATYLQRNLLETGMGSTGWDARKGQEGTDKAGCTNDLWEDHHWKTIGEVLNI